MANRDYGPIPCGVWEDPRVIELGLKDRAILFSILAICCYHGRFPRDPRVLCHKIAVTDVEYLAESLDRMSERGVIEEWMGSRRGGRGEWVGSVRGYHDWAGLPRDRRNKQPKTPEYPDVDPRLPARSPGAPRTLPGGSPHAPRGLIPRIGEDRSDPYPRDPEINTARAREDGHAPTRTREDEGELEIVDLGSEMDEGESEPSPEMERRRQQQLAALRSF